jgi:hypothetical protein
VSAAGATAMQRVWRSRQLNRDAANDESERRIERAASNVQRSTSNVLKRLTDFLVVDNFPRLDLVKVFTKWDHDVAH